jgi:glucosyl-dolichyl phosphate glucuronosyltransferase
VSENRIREAALIDNKYKICAVICTYNRDKYLLQALNSFKNQTLNKESFQLIIVDNNSTDNTAIISKEFVFENPFLNIKYCFEAQKGLSFARNRGLMEAEAPIISYVDDDAFLSPYFLEKMNLFFKNHPNVAGVGGKVIPLYEQVDEPKWMSKYLNGFVGKLDYGNFEKQFDDKMKYPAGCNMTYTKEVLLKAGGFNNELTFRSDDKYIFYAVKKVGGEVWYVPETYVFHIIDDARLHISNFEKLYLKTGNEEKIRIREEAGIIGVMKKGIQYLIKLLASIILYFKFVIEGENLKGKYVVLSQYFTLKGFLLKNVFVR